MSTEKASKEGYGAGQQGKSSDDNPYKSEGVIDRMFDIATYQVHDKDEKSEAWESSRGAGANDKGKEK